MIVALDDEAAALARLPELERARAAALSPNRRREFIAGRTALHLALGSDAAILSDDRGAPALPPGWVGRRDQRGGELALVAPAGTGHIGVDLEHAAAPRTDIARRILTPREQAQLPDRDRAVTLRFSIKEAIYKALDPYVRRYVGFTEVELEFAGDAVTVTTALPFAIAATWREHAGYWLATARAVPR